jgi:hypothetical protein
MRRGDTQTTDLIQLALDDEAVFETVYESSMGEARRFGVTSGAFSVLEKDGQLLVDNLLKLLQWFVTNGPMLIEIIEQIIGLFGSVETTRELFEDETLFVD